MKWSLPSRWAFAGSLSSPLSFSIAAVPLQYGRPLAVKQRPATTTNFERSRQTEQSGGRRGGRPAFLTSVLPSLSVPYFHSFRRSLDCQLSKKLPRTWRLDGDGRRPTMERETEPADKGSLSHSRSTSFFLCHNATELSISNHQQVDCRSALATSGLN